MNRYGLLFHLNKDWQRLNARRQRLLQRLSTPEKFNVFFQKEMDGISDSLSRVSLSLSDTACYPQSLLCDPDFIHRFAQLLKQIEAMEDSLKIYNEQVIDQEPVGCAEIGS
jgi:phospholipid/cholesterol/gamma-HCH transport system substrate-binding protein